MVEGLTEDVVNQCLETVVPRRPSATPCQSVSECRRACVCASRACVSQSVAVCVCVCVCVCGRERERVCVREREVHFFSSAGGPPLSDVPP